MFKVGEKVIYIGTKSLEHGNIYTIKGIMEYPCGCMAIDVGLTINYIAHQRCGDHFSFANALPSQVQYVKSSSFKPLQYDESAIEELVNIKQITETSDLPMKNPSPTKPMKELINNN